MTYKLIVQVFPHHIEVSECPDFILHLLGYIPRVFESSKSQSKIFYKRKKFATCDWAKEFLWAIQQGAKTRNKTLAGK